MIEMSLEIEEYLRSYSMEEISNIIKEMFTNKYMIETDKSIMGTERKRELRPYDECPHCSSYNYKLVYIHLGTNPDMLYWECELCEFRKPQELPRELE